METKPSTLKPCCHCGGKADQHQAWFPNSLHEYVQCEQCGVRTGDCTSPHDAADIWNSRCENNPSEADRWLKEATEQRDRADKAEEESAEFSEALSQARRMLAYAGKLQ